MKILRKHLKGPVLIFGGEGALGSEIAQRLELNGIMVLKTKHSEFSINPSKSEIYKYIHSIGPSVVINCAAMTGLDNCALDRKQALITNAHLPVKIQLWVDKYKIPMIHFSTDNIFGLHSKKLPTESTVPFPLTWYGITKYLGEINLLNSSNTIIIRLPMLFGPTNKKQLISKLTFKAMDGENIFVSKDISSTISYTPNIARWIESLLIYEFELPSKIIHLTSDKKITLYQCMKDILLQLDKLVYLKPVKSDYFKNIEQKQKNGGLGTLFTIPFSYDLSICDYVENLKNNYRNN